MTPSKIIALTGTLKRLPKNEPVTPDMWHRVQFAADSLVNILDGIDIETVTNREAHSVASAVGRAIEIAMTNQQVKS